MVNSQRTAYLAICLQPPANTLEFLAAGGMLCCSVYVLEESKKQVGCEVTAQVRINSWLRPL